VPTSSLSSRRQRRCFPLKIATPTPPYQHDRLYQRHLRNVCQEIRILTLKCDTFDDAIHCVLNAVSLIDSPTYTALSYIWGDQIDRLPLYVDGIEVSVIKNLSVVLRYIRKPDQDLFLWVDALCIDKNDVQERNNQVPLMGTLYSEAQDVIIWLGEAGFTTDDLACIIAQINLRAPHVDMQDMAPVHYEYEGARAMFAECGQCKSVYCHETIQPSNVANTVSLGRGSSTCTTISYHSCKRHPN
jgi:hypothetical protein